jgi:hypothetical protein
MQNDESHWDRVRAELGAENAAGVAPLSVPVHRSGCNKQRGMEQRGGNSFEIEVAEPSHYQFQPLATPALACLLLSNNDALNFLTAMPINQYRQSEL